MFETIQQKAEKKVVKAVSVFEQAIAKIEKAQEILKYGLGEDNKKVTQTKLNIRAMEDKLLEIEQDKLAKIDAINNNHILKTKLENFMGES